MFLGRQKIINPLGQKPAFGWFLSCVGNNLPPIRISRSPFPTYENEPISSLHCNFLTGLCWGTMCKAYWVAEAVWLTTTADSCNLDNKTTMAVILLTNTFFSVNTSFPFDQECHFILKLHKWLTLLPLFFLFCAAVNIKSKQIPQMSWSAPSQLENLAVYANFTLFVMSCLYNAN